MAKIIRKDNADIEIKIISVGKPSIPFDGFDDPVEQMLTPEKEIEIKKSAERAFKEMSDFFKIEHK